MSYSFQQKRFLKAAKIKYDRMRPFVDTDEKVLDIGSGSCALAKTFKNSGFDITAMDIRNKSRFEDLPAIAYDGNRFPFEDNTFDTSFMITMLHHTPDPAHIIKEAMRVSKKLIIMEDIYRNGFQKHLTYFTDSLVNMEFKGHPHTNRDDKGWRELFQQLGLKVEHSEEYRFLMFFRQVTYVLSTP